jgi:DNA-binding IclR family transcriptional regulator
VLDRAPLTALTPHTITDPAALRLELARVRRRGWAEAVNEREIGVASLAAPIRDVRGEVIAAISIGAPIARLGSVNRRRLAEVVADAGEAVSRRLGWSPETMMAREG